MKLARLDVTEQEKQKVIAELKDKSFNVMREVAKKEWIKTSFWMPENAAAGKPAGQQEPDLEETKEEGKKKKLKMSCPFAPATSDGESHSIKFKDLVPLKLSEDASEGKISFIC